jgi:hypothetical protein
MAEFGDNRLPERFWNKVHPCPMTGCWLWMASSNRGGYGQLRVAELGRPVVAHKIAYEALVGQIPEGLFLDHVRARGCVSRGCVNPAHLEPVTNRENVIRGNSASANRARAATRTHCPSGHEYSHSNARQRFCRICRNESSKQYQARKRAKP